MKNTKLMIKQMAKKHNKMKAAEVLDKLTFRLIAK